MADTRDQKEDAMRGRLYFAVINDLSYDQRMIRICNTLRGNGYDVTLVGRELKESIPLKSMPYNQHRLKCWWRKGPFFYIEFNIRLFLYLLRQKAALPGACDLDTSLAVRMAAFFKGCKSVFDAHEYFTEVPELKGRRIVRKIWEWIGKKTVPGFSLRYTVSESLANILAEKYKSPFLVIRNLPELKEATPLSLKERAQAILYQGALNAGRGLETAILAMHRIDGYKLILAGEGDLSDSLRQLVNDEGLEERVVFKGWIAPNELRLLTGTAILGLNLLDGSSLNYFYSLSNKFFDYMQAGVPSVNPPFPEYRAILEKYNVGVILPELNEGALGNMLNQLLDDPGRLSAMVDSCLRAKQEYCWEVEKEALVRMFQNLSGA